MLNRSRFKENGNVGSTPASGNRVFIGIVAAMLEIGGGVFMVPTLVLFPWYALNSAVASGTSLAAITFTSVSSTFRYMKQKRIDHLLGLALASTTIPGAFFRFIFQVSH